MDLYSRSALKRGCIMKNRYLAEHLYAASFASYHYDIKVREVIIKRNDCYLAYTIHLEIFSFTVKDVNLENSTNPF